MMLCRKNIYTIYHIQNIHIIKSKYLNFKFKYKTLCPLITINVNLGDSWGVITLLYTLLFILIHCYYNYKLNCNYI